MQTLGARFQMRRVSLEPGRQPEAGMGSQIVERAVGSVAWRCVFCGVEVSMSLLIFSVNEYSHIFL